MTYYDDDFRKILLDILKTYRETLVQESIKPKNEENRTRLTGINLQSERELFIKTTCHENENARAVRFHNYI